VVAAVDVLVTLYERYQQPPPGVRRVTRWRRFWAVPAEHLPALEALAAAA